MTENCQKSNFGSDQTIPSRDLILQANLPSAPTKEIQEWVQEQGIALGSPSSRSDVTQELLAFWGSIPENRNSITFKKSSDQFPHADGFPRHKVTHHFQ
jgi:hypothetical protein